MCARCRRQVRASGAHSNELGVLMSPELARMSATIRMACSRPAPAHRSHANSAEACALHSREDQPPCRSSAQIEPRFTVRR
eukprot:9330921-Alexandrium_andersonii.AAC.1